jgi:recombination protein RecR
MYSPLTKQLIDALCALPGIGPRSAQRMAFGLLAPQGRQKGLSLAQSLSSAMTHVGQCQHCRNYCEQPTCSLCTNPKRVEHTLCIVQTPADLYALEQTRSFNGYYFVLHGHLSPLEGLGPDDIGIEQLLTRIDALPIKEVVLATNSTMEGEATAQYIAAILEKKNIPSSRIAHGIPIGGELEYLDGGTLGHAFTSRIPTHKQTTED